MASKFVNLGLVEEGLAVQVDEASFRLLCSLRISVPLNNGLFKLVHITHVILLFYVEVDFVPLKSDFHDVLDRCFIDLPHVVNRLVAAIKHLIRCCMLELSRWFLLLRSF